jgi:cytochrome c oxidase subunit 4
MHADPAEVQKTVRTYLLIGAALFAFTVITVAVNQVHLAVPAAITVAVIIASIKGSMVASVFMHLSHEKKWIYGSLLLTVAFFILLMLVPLLTISDTIGKPINAPSAVSHTGAAAPEHEQH